MNIHRRSLCAMASLAAAVCVPSALYAQRFQGEIQQMLARDKTNPPPQGGILFIGSSIFRFWTHLSEQMAPLPVFNHAFGGSVTQDILDRADQLVFPYKPRIIVYYCGSNDVGGGEPAGAIIGRTKQFLKIAGERLPDTFVYYTAIQKAPDKRDRWDVVETVNREMERYSHQAKNLGFIDLNPVLFDKKGNVRMELFLPDELHFRPESTAYAEFAAVVKPILTKAWESRHPYAVSSDGQRFLVNVAADEGTLVPEGWKIARRRLHRENYSTQTINRSMFKHRKNERGFPSLADSGITGRE